MTDNDDDDTCNIIALRRILRKVNKQQYLASNTIACKVKTYLLNGVEMDRYTNRFKDNSMAFTTLTLLLFMSNR